MLAARRRLDVVCMLLARALHAKFRMSRAPICFCLMADASPQWKGTELFGGWCDRITQEPGGGDGIIFVRRQMPLNTLAFKHLSVADKVHSVLWMVMLEVGPSFRAMRWFLDHVISWTTDLGTEHHIVNSSDVLPNFIRMLNPTAKVPEPGPSVLARGSHETTRRLVFTWRLVPGRCDALFA
jgi:hypothetical protein